jgi:hypothetical protein
MAAALPALAQNQPAIGNQTDVTQNPGIDQIVGQNHVMIVRGSLHNDVSPAVRDLPTLEQSGQAHVEHEAEPGKRA